MLKYIFKRLMAGVLTIIVLITVAFFMMHAMPGSPFTQSEQRDIPPEVLERMIASYGLDRPVFEQYLSYWKSLLNGDLGLSFKQANKRRSTTSSRRTFPSRRASAAWRSSSRC